MNEKDRMYRLIPLIRQDKIITYKNEKYPIDFQLILQNSNYFYKNQKRYENIDDIELTQVPNNITKESMEAFIKSIQNDEFSINDKNVFSLHQLSIKYEVPKLTEITTEYINEHNIDLIFDTIKYEELTNSKEQFCKENEEPIKFFSISQSSKTQNTFDWPTNQNVEQVEEKRCQLLESLISYSIELEKVEKLEKSPKWTMQCEHPDSESIMEEFYKNKSISPKSISYYKSILKAQLLKDLTEIDEKDPYKYCNNKKIIMFFNKFKNRYNIIEDYWVVIAKKLSKTYPIDFCISIPTFEPFDILSLLINPISKKQGCIFEETQCPQKLLDDFNDLYNEITKKSSEQSFKYISRQIGKIIIKYTKNLHPNTIKKNFNEDELDDFSLFYNKILDKNILNDIQEICKRIQIMNNISESITTPLNKDEFKDENFEYLDFSDVMDIDFDNFNLYIDKNPCIGFYITQFPQVKDKIAKIADLCSDNKKYDNNKLPLALFEFRVFSRIICIEFQIPSEFPHDLAEDFRSFLYKKIFTHLTSVPKISNFSNFIPFLLSNIPKFITDACYSQHLRNIVINFISSPKEKLLKIEMLQFLKRFLPKIIEIMGTPKWMNYINKELKYESKDEIIGFLTNPWRFALEDINKALIEEYENKEFDVQKVVKNIISMIINLSSDKSIERLKECVRKDESELRDKIYNEYLNTKKNSKKETEIEKELNKEWIDYSKYIKSYLESKLATLPTTISNNIYQPDDSYSSFHIFFSQKLNYLPCRSTEVIALLPKKSKSSTYKLFYTINNQKVSVKFQSSEGKPMLFLPPRNQRIESLNLQCKGVDIQIDVIQSDFEVVKFKYTSMRSIEESYKKFNKCFETIQKDDFEDNDSIQIIKKLGKTNIAFGDKTLDEFIKKLKILNAKYIKDEIKNFYGKPDELDKIRNDILELEEFTNISFLIDHVEKPHQTTDFLQGYLINIITSAKNNLVKSNFDLFSNEYDKKHKFFSNFRSEFQKLYKVSTKLYLRPKNVRSYNVETSEQEIYQIEASEQLLIPSIFINEEELKVTIKKIIVEVDPLVFGVEVSPLQIRLENFTEKEIICEFDQDEEDLPIPKYRNEIRYLIIEIPVESICSSGLKYAKNDESKQKKPTNKKNELIEKTFIFNGVITLSINDESIIPCTIEYHISLHYISLIEFISIKNNHFFALKDNTIEIVPFLAGPNSKLIFEKFTDKAIKRHNMLDLINELNDNKATKPDFISRINCEDKRSTDITTVFAKDKIENSYLSMNYEFRITKEQSLISSLHINTSPKLNKVDQVTLAIFSDPIRNFTDKDAIVNIGNLKRKVYFFVGILNNSNEPISPNNIKLSAYTYTHNYYFEAKYDENKNKNTIPPNQYGYAIYYFEARYTGSFPFPNKDRYDASITVTINGITQTLNFKYKINAIDNQVEKFKYNTNIFDCLYYDQKKGSFTQCDVRNVSKDPIFQSCEKQILISPFCYSLYDKSNSLTRIEYDHNKGVLSRLIYDKSKPPIFEVFGFFSDQKRFMVVTIDRPERITLHDRNTYIFARIKDEPNTFFPLFCPMKNNNQKFDARKCTSDNIYRTFINFFLSLMPTCDQDARKAYSNYSTLDNLFDQTPLPSTYDFSFIIDLIGKGRKHLALNELVPIIIRFTNNIEFRDHYQDSRTQFKSDPQGQFYSFISALNELANKRYEFLQTTNYYLKSPIPFDVIEEKQNEIFQKIVLNKDQIEKNKYINDFKKNIENINNIEQEAIKKFIDKGFEITPILKWTETNGITASTIEELNEHKKHKTQQTINIKTIKDENSEINTKDIKSIEFPENPTIKSFYDTFKDVMSSTYNLTYIIYSLKKNHQPLHRARKLLNQLIAIFLWQNECSDCFPFSSFAKCYNTAFISMIQRLFNSKLQIINFPLFLLEKSNFNEFVQVPSLIVANINYPKFTKPGLAINITVLEQVIINDEDKHFEESGKNDEIELNKSHSNYGNELIQQNNFRNRGRSNRPRRSISGHRSKRGRRNQDQISQVFEYDYDLD